MRTTHTYVTLELSPVAFAEIRDKLNAAGYLHCFIADDPPRDRTLIIMNGIAVAEDKTPLNQ